MLLLAVVPSTMSANVVQKLTSLFILVMLAAMWNALAGYGGLVSVGQQAYFGIGAYGTILITHQSISPYFAMLLAILLAGIISVPLSYLLLRLRGGQFSIATWVVAEVFASSWASGRPSERARASRSSNSTASTWPNASTSPTG